MNKRNRENSIAISVVIPAYNVGRYLGRALASVCSQVQPVDEVIVVDDGSTDQTKEQAAEFEGVRYLYQPNAGASAARNRGIRAARNEWIAFLDGDDEWLPGKLARQRSLLEENPELEWTTGNFYIEQAGGRRKEKLAEEVGRTYLCGSAYFEEYFEAYVRGAAGWTGTMLIRKEVLEEAGLFRPGQWQCNDLDMWWRIAYRHRAIGYSSEPLAIYYRDIADSITKRYRDPDILRELLERHLELSAEQGRRGAFELCATYTLRYWLHYYLLDERIDQVREIVDRFSALLPASYQRRLRLLTWRPGLTRACLPLLRKLNRFLKISV